MPVKKKAGTAVATRKGDQLPANIDAELEAEAAGIGSTIDSSGGSFIKLDQKNGEFFDIPNLGQSEAPMSVVIVDYISVNSLYKGKYDPSNIAPPNCWAINKDIGLMVPSERVEDPEADACNGCPNNEFGSDGNGKACKNTKLLAVLPPGSTDDDELAYIRVSPTGLKSFNSFVSGVAARMKKPPVSVIVELNIVASGAGFTLQFGKTIPNPQYREDFMRRSEAIGVLTAEPQVQNDNGTKRRSPPPKRRAAAKRK
jgi:hypothetical protein